MTDLFACLAVERKVKQANGYSRRLTTAALLPLLLWAGLLLYPQAAASQRQGRPISEVETRFQRALDQYTKGEFAQARAEFQALLALSPPHPQSSASALMLAKTLYKLQAYDLAIAAVAQLYEEFPQSRYLPEGDLVAGDCRFRKGETDAAVDNYVKVLKGEGDVRLKARAADRLGEMVAARRLASAQIQRLKRDLAPIRFDEVVQFGQVRWAFRLGRSDAGASQAATFLKTFPDSPFAGEVRALMRTAPERPLAAAPLSPLSSTDRPDRLKVAVLCPISRDLGKELRDGIVLARDLMPLATGDPLNLVFENSNDDPITSIKLVQKLALDRDVVAIIGDLTSRSTVPAAAAANASQVPLITPTASEDGIASIGTYIFQVNATPGAQGRKIAEYAFRAGLRTFAILASLDAYGKHMAEAFVDRTEALGGKVVLQEWYTPGTADFQNQIQRVREVGAALAGTAAVSGPPDTSAAVSDTVQVVVSIDGLLVAAQSPEDVVLIVSQIAAHHITTYLLGGDGWNSPRVSREIGGVVQNALFVSKYFEDSADAPARRFREAFRARFGRPPNVASALGYDAMTCILKAIAAGGYTREALRERLAAGQDFSGATGRVLLAPGERENSGMYILTIQDGRIAPANVEGQ